MKSKAFTLYESLIVIVIVSIIVILSFKIYKNQEEKTLGNLYSKAYKTLNTACYNVLQEVVEYNDQKNLEYQEKGISNAPASELKRFPNVLGQNTAVTPANLCDALVGTDGYLNVSTSGCNITSYTSFSNGTKDTSSLTPSFVTSDGMKYYITNYSNTALYLVWVDINGGRRPNANIFINGKRPDVVPFLIDKDKGVVVPLGIPTYDTVYLKARVLYADPDLDKDYSTPITFKEAQYRAYNSKTWTLDPLSKSISLSSTLLQGTIPPSQKSDSNCSSSGYDTARDFPPCMVEISTFMK